MIFSALQFERLKAEEVELLKRPACNLYTICPKKIEATSEDIRLLAQNFRLLHGKLSKDQFEAIHKINPDFKCLAYVNSAYTRSVEEAGVVEANYRRGICMHLSVELVEAIAPDQMRSGMCKIVQDVPGAAVVSIDGLSKDGGVHYDTQGQIEPARRFAAAYLEMIGKKPASVSFPLIEPGDLGIRTQERG
ncbi:MAG: hypothetical protein NTX50_17400 [Candidatus Sumerlaeota bacterium]|nr:hypothetical protein [Candidatus Sumerlaeota bacterium]